MRAQGGVDREGICIGPIFVSVNARVVDNLLSNALKFTAAKGRISLCVSPDAGHALVRVKDTGIGIPDEIKDTVFRRFTDAGRQGTNKETSTGLGLSIAKDIVETMHGRIWFESVKGMGSTFFVELPLARSPALRAREELSQNS